MKSHKDHTSIYFFYLSKRVEPWFPRSAHFFLAASIAVLTDSAELVAIAAISRGADTNSSSLNVTTAVTLLFPMLLRLRKYVNDVCRLGAIILWSQ